MNIAEKYLNKIQNEVSNTSGLSFHIDSFTSTKNNIKKNILDVNEQDHLRKDRILIDFDNTIHDYYKGWQNGEIYGNIIKDSKESIDTLRQLDVKIYIFTTRLSGDNKNREDQIQKISKWLDEHDIQVDGITSDKIGALIYIDDKGFRLYNWKENLPQIIEIIKSEREQNIK